MLSEVVQGRHMTTNRERDGMDTCSNTDTLVEPKMRKIERKTTNRERLTVHLLSFFLITLLFACTGNDANRPGRWS